MKKDIKKVEKKEEEKVEVPEVKKEPETALDRVKARRNG